MRIQHNISALNASNKLKINESSISKNIAKLSSGYRINSAADDAAGLAVSEKMRAQINGLSQAQDNTKNGISLIQTAEGGLNETSAILQRMNTLATESSNGTYQNAPDRANLQKEVDSLASEIDRISTSTNFNKINLLDGSLSSSASQVEIDPHLAANVQTTAAVNGVNGATISKGLTTTNGAASAVYTFSVSENGATTTHTVELDLAQAGTAFNYKVDGGSSKAGAANGATTKDTTAAEVAAALKEAIATTDWGSKGLTADVTGSTAAMTFTSKIAGTAGPQVTGISYEIHDDGGKADGSLGVTTTTPALDAAQVLNTTNQTIAGGDSAVNAQSKVFSVGGRKFALAATGDIATVQGLVGNDVDILDKTDMSKAVTEINKVVGQNVVYEVTSTTDATPTSVAGGFIAFGDGTGASGNGKALTFQVGADNKADQRVSLSVGDMSSKGLGIAGLSVATQPDAQKAIDTIKNAVNMVSTTRADLGALQNELEHTSNNLSTMGENLTSAESTIRDVDMTDEYVQYSKNQILSQAANAMLAQANTQPQNVLSLIKG